MCLSGEDQLDRPSRVVQQAGEPGRIREQQVRPLVSSEAPCETECKRVGIEHVRGSCDHLGRIAAAAELPRQPSAHLLDQGLPFLAGHNPQLFVRKARNQIGKRVRHPPPALLATSRGPQMVGER